MKTHLLCLALLTSLVTVSSSGSAQLPVIQWCENSQFHTYHLGTSPGWAFEEWPWGSYFIGARHAQTFDTCPVALSFGGIVAPQATDHDPDAGVGGGRFYASSTCGPTPGEHPVLRMSWSPHHAWAPGSTYEVDNVLGAIAYVVGTDGPVDPNRFGPCMGNGVVTDDALLDPFDCGQGDVGFDFGFPPTLATIGPNTNLASCDPADGYTQVFLIQGLVTICRTSSTSSYRCLDVDLVRNPPIEESIFNGDTFLSTPMWGTIRG